MNNRSRFAFASAAALAVSELARADTSSTAPDLITHLGLGYYTEV